MHLRPRDLVGPLLLTVVLVGLIVVIYLGAK
jgi:hypothetical protein